MKGNGKGNSGFGSNPSEGKDGSSTSSSSSSSSIREYTKEQRKKQGPEVQALHDGLRRAMVQRNASLTDAKDSAGENKKESFAKPNSNQSPRDNEEVKEEKTPVSTNSGSQSTTYSSDDVFGAGDENFSEDEGEEKDEVDLDLSKRNLQAIQGALREQTMGGGTQTDQRRQERQKAVEEESKSPQGSVRKRADGLGAMLHGGSRSPSPSIPQDSSTDAFHSPSDTPPVVVSPTPEDQKKIDEGDKHLNELLASFEGGDVPPPTRNETQNQEMDLGQIIASFEQGGSAFPSIMVPPTVGNAASGASEPVRKEEPRDNTPLSRSAEVKQLSRQNSQVTIEWEPYAKIEKRLSSDGLGLLTKEKNPGFYILEKDKADFPDKEYSLLKDKKLKKEGILIVSPKKGGKSAQDEQLDYLFGKAVDIYPAHAYGLRKAKGVGFNLSHGKSFWGAAGGATWEAEEALPRLQEVYEGGAQEELRTIATGQKELGAAIHQADEQKQEKLEAIAKAPSESARRLAKTAVAKAAEDAEVDLPAEDKEGMENAIVRILEAQYNEAASSQQVDGVSLKEREKAAEEFRIKCKKQEEIRLDSSPTLASDLASLLSEKLKLKGADGTKDKAGQAEEATQRLLAVRSLEFYANVQQEVSSPAYHLGGQKFEAVKVGDVWPGQSPIRLPFEVKGDVAQVKTTLSSNIEKSVPLQQLVKKASDDVVDLTVIPRFSETQSGGVLERAPREKPSAPAEGGVTPQVVIGLNDGGYTREQLESCVIHTRNLLAQLEKTKLEDRDAFIKGVISPSVPLTRDEVRLPSASNPLSSTVVSKLQTLEKAVYSPQEYIREDGEKAKRVEGFYHAMQPLAYLLRRGLSVEESLALLDGHTVAYTEKEAEEQKQLDKALALAVVNSQPRDAALLLNNGANPKATVPTQEGNEVSILHIAALMGGEILKTVRSNSMVSSHEIENLTDSAGKTPLDYAEKSENPEVATNVLRQSVIIPPPEPIEGVGYATLLRSSSLPPQASLPSHIGQGAPQDVGTDGKGKGKEKDVRKSVALEKGQENPIIFSGDDATNTELQDLKKYATEGNQEGITGLLQQSQRIGVNDPLNEKQQTALHLAAQSGQEGTVLLLLERGANPDLMDTEGKVPLHHAAEKGGIGVVEMLVGNNRAKQTINRVDNEGNTPLHLAGAEKSKPSEDSGEPRKGDYKKVMKALLKAGAETEVLNAKGEGVNSFGVFYSESDAELGAGSVAAESVAVNRPRVISSESWGFQEEASNHGRSLSNAGVSLSTDGTPELQGATSQNREFTDLNEIFASPSRVASVSPNQGAAVPSQGQQADDPFALIAAGAAMVQPTSRAPQTKAVRSPQDNDGLEALLRELEQSTVKSQQGGQPVGRQQQQEDDQPVRGQQQQEDIRRVPLPQDGWSEVQGEELPPVEGWGPPPPPQAGQQLHGLGPVPPRTRQPAAGPQPMVFAPPPPQNGQVQQPQPMVFAPPPPLQNGQVQQGGQPVVGQPQAPDQITWRSKLPATIDLPRWGRVDLTRSPVGAYIGRNLTEVPRSALGQLRGAGNAIPNDIANAIARMKVDARYKFHIEVVEGERQAARREVQSRTGGPSL